MTTPLTPAELAELERLEKEATDGRWYVEESRDWWELYAERLAPEEMRTAVSTHLHPFKIAKCAKRGQSYAEYWPNQSDSELIVALRNAAPALLRAAREAAELRALVREAAGKLAASDELSDNYALHTGGRNMSDELVKRLRERFKELKAQHDHHLEPDFLEAADRIETLEAALREPDRVARIIRNMAEWTPEMRAMLVDEIRRRWGETEP